MGPFFGSLIASAVVMIMILLIVIGRHLREIRDELRKINKSEEGS